MSALGDAAAPGAPALTRRALERARRAAPGDPMAALRLALVCLQEGDPSAAAALFNEISARHDVADVWLGLAASALQTGAVTNAAAAMQACLSRHAATPTTMQLAAAIARAAGAHGWCAVDGRGRLRSDAAADVSLDGVTMPLRWSAAGVRVPPGRLLEVARSGQPLLGSPIDLAAINAIEGFVEAQSGGIAGWAWHPGNPERNPVVKISGATELSLTLTALRPDATGMRPLARPRHFAVAAPDLPAGVLRVTGPDGRDFWGSPLDPGLERRGAAGLEPRWLPIWADVVGAAATAPPVARPVDVVMPVYGNRSLTLACVDAVLTTLPRGSRLHVVDDGSPDPLLVAALQSLARRGRIRLLRQPQNRGYPAAVNAGMQAAAGRDVVLLNSDTLTPPGWLQALTAAARSAPGIGTACPLSNAATILSYPDATGGNPMPDLQGTAVLAALAAQANGAAVTDVPTAVGFCMFIRRECLDQVGPFREDLFAQGYGEENDFCLRARHLGWRHVAALGAFVAHAGGASFGGAQHHLQARNAAVLGRLHPGYDAMIAAWMAEDTLAPARLRMDALRWRAGRMRSSVVLVTHGGVGGVDRIIAAQAADLRQQGIRPIVLRPDHGAVVVGEQAGASDTPNLRFAMPGALGALVRLLRADRPIHVELHHMLGHDPALLRLAGLLGVPYDVHVHDYAWFCPRIALVRAHNYCGEPAVAECVHCIADHGAKIEEDIPVAALVERSAATLGEARRVITPAKDVALRLQRHFPLVRGEVMPWEDDARIAPPPPPGRIRRVCVIGGIGVEKGYGVLLACLRDVARRALPLSFSLVGHSSDDDRLLAAGPIEITGKYRPDEVDGLVRAQAADIAFLPSIWPETWCFTLSHAWQAGLRAAVFDIGAPAARVRRSGWGWVLPLGLPPAAVNDWMLRFDALQQRSSLAT